MKAIFAYIPVVHTGTLSFLRSHNLPLLLLDNEAAKTENVYLERDIRALQASDIKKELEAHGFTGIRVVAPVALKEECQKYESLVVPQDEIIDQFLQKYVPLIPVEKDITFLRWTKQISSVEHEVPEDRVVTTEEFARELMLSLEDEAVKSEDWWRQIAAAIVRDGKVLVVAHNKHHPSVHALTINGDPRSNFDAGQGAGIYTSIHAEACARALLEAGIARVFYKRGYSLLDAEEILKAAGVEIILVKD